METTAQCFLLNTDKHAETTQIGAAVLLPDGFMAVAGFVGVMPSVVAERVINAAGRAGVQVVELMDDRDNRITVIVWGDFPVKNYYDLIAMGIAESATKAIFNALHEATEEVANSQTADDDEIPV